MVEEDPSTVPFVVPPKQLVTLETSFSNLVQNVNNAMDNQEYHKIIHYTTFAMDRLLMQQRMILLDIRAYAYSKQNQPDLAIADAHQMIGETSTSGDGYLRKANVFEMYGKMKKAIETYDEGLQNVSLDDEHQRLQLRRDMATHRHSSQIDFLAKLPTEILDTYIIPLLSPNTKLTCLTVSKAWREKILDCSLAWESLLLSDCSKKATQIIDIIPSIGCYVKHLTIDNSIISSGIDTTCFTLMQDGYFNKMKSLKVKISDNSQDIQQGLHPTIMVVAFWQTRYTLTMLNLDFSDRINVLGLADIIFTCINLAKLSFTTTLPLVSFIGNFSTIKQHDALIDLKINAKRITGQDIELMLKRCHKLRRLIMHTCDTSVFDAIHKYTPRLEILGYNPDRTVPELEDNRKGKEGGLRMLYTNNGKTSVRAASILPVIYKSQATLETLNAILSSANILQLHELYTTYPDFELSSIKHMTFWGKSGIQQFLLRSIRNTTTLTKLHAINVHDVEGFVNGIFHLSSISRFSLSYTKDMVGHPSLARLLQKYATKSEESSSTPASSLTFLRFRYCTPILDDLLLIVASIKTLQELDLRGLTNISTDGINIMINKFSEHRHQQLKKVELYDMDCIRDSTLVALGQLKNLTYLHIKDLKNVSDEGISAIVETVEEGYLDLDHLCVERCPKVTQASINHAKQKINVVKYNK